MPAKTTNKQITYPLAADKISDYPSIAKESAETVDAALSAVTLYEARSGAKSASATQTVSLGQVTFTLATPSQVLIYGASQVRPTGNAAGNLSLNVDGNPVIYSSWHSQNTANHQWPTAFTGLTLAAGSHTIEMTCSVGSGSNAVTTDNSTLSVVVLGA